MPPIVTLTTDFGLADSFVGTMKGVLLSRCPAAQLVDICHDVPAQNVRIGALRLAAAVPYFPQSTVHLAVVDPGVGGPRRPIAISAGGQCFVGPDNGLLSLAAPKRAADWRAVELTNPRYWLPVVSNTFQGRDIFAPVAAHLAAGGNITALGHAIDSVVEIILPAVRRTGNRVAGLVLDVDRFGNLVTNIRREDLKGQTVESVEIGGVTVTAAACSYDPLHPLVAVMNSDGWLEVAAPGRNAASLLSIGLDAPVWVSLVSH